MSYLITSKNNESIKHASKLIGSSKIRNRNRQFVIEGLRLCMDAVKSETKILKTFVTQEFCDKYKSESDLIMTSSKFSYLINEKILKAISDTDCPQGVVCICEMSQHIFNLAEAQGNIVILDGIQNPANLGAIIRTCDALNFSGVIISKDSCDIYNPKALRSSMGSVFRVKFYISDDLKKIIDKLNKCGFITLAMDLQKDSKDIRKVKLNNKCAVVIGNEGSGIKQKLKDICLYRAIIPISENSDSLNAAVAAGIVMWEITR